MKTYKTYREAQIDNNALMIYKYLTGLFSTSFTATSRPCHPSDYCMSLKDFFMLGYKLSAGDVYINEEGINITVMQEYLDCVNKKAMRDERRYILKAKALELLIETPEEKEAFDSIKPIADVEIKKGQVCEITGEEGSFIMVGFTKNGCVVERNDGLLEIYPKCALNKGCLI